MHHALLISELCGQICSLLDQASLALLARTCSALRDSALDELWKDLYTLHPFLYLLSQDPCDNSDSGMTSVRRPSAEEWETLRKYAARTRSLYMCIIEDPPITVDRFLALSNPPGAIPLFPNLRTLAWYPSNHQEMLPFLRLLCGPSITSLSAEFAIDPASLSMLASLGTLCPNVSDISISAANAVLTDDMTVALSTSICQWHLLKEVACDDLSISAMEHLSQTRGLESLTVFASQLVSSFTRGKEVREKSFARLRHLHLYAGQLPNATACLEGLHLVLKEFRIDLFDVEEVLSSPHSLWDFSMALADHCARDTLAEVDFCIVDSELLSEAAVTMFRDISPLLSFSNLRVVRFEGLTTLSLDDKDIFELSCAWLRVEELSLTTCVGPTVTALPTFHSLIHLTRCRKLKVLSLVINAAKRLESCFRGFAEHFNLCSDVLRELRLGNSPVESPIYVARVLGDLYPSLQSVDLSVWNKGPLNHLPRRALHDLWCIVNCELRGLKAEKGQGDLGEYRATFL
ncbi:hypothetical protein HYDPIDRAFT_42699 [Hydnomerulius pinastri MD-312]|uniref:F-box domain-containing protein n=1 Tax=Hydnomerulius pinastri MD-312 TaxID=994086 RepID=A0A0C9V6P3_9AGAM|nr:hypothetical protein HYDPIDRAFT_42699 [Hydnomerulius pinastri MD-312]